MQEWLKVVEENPQLRKTIKHHVYMNRLQKRIDRELGLFEWLVKKHPDLYLDGKRDESIREKRMLSILDIETKIGEEDVSVKGEFLLRQYQTAKENFQRYKKMLLEAGD